VSSFQRVLILRFLSGGSKDVDANGETVRLLRSQLRNLAGHTDAPDVGRDLLEV
jgi:hypothetical protein